ncbi:MerR family transcriptional regulator [Dactylosporangium sp. NPDC000555]|uniref:MerR family transcriptional regulator n=1 Tax=Dactylosporangium sp. NPDC000555 TaxID=3154260 RepID=UPI00332F122F
MRIGELARRTSVSARSLRYYEQQGLLSPARAENGYREYDELAVIHAVNIKDLMDLALTVDDIREFKERGCLDRPLSRQPSCASALSTVHARLEILDERIERLSRLRERLAAHGEKIERGLGPGEVV